MVYKVSMSKSMKLIDKINEIEFILFWPNSIPVSTICVIVTCDEFYSYCTFMYIGIGVLLAY